MCLSIYLYMCKCIDMYIYIFMYMHACICVCMFVCVHSTAGGGQLSVLIGKVGSLLMRSYGLSCWLWNTTECSNVNNNSGRASFYIFHISCKILIYIKIYFQSCLTKISPASKSNKNTYKSDWSAFRLIICQYAFSTTISTIALWNRFQRL